MAERLPRQEKSEKSDDIAVIPIRIPLIAGPGAIKVAMLLSSQTPHLYSYFTLVFSIFFVLSLVYVILRNGDLLQKLLLTTVTGIIQRLMGLIIMVMAVYLFIIRRLRDKLWTQYCLFLNVIKRFRFFNTNILLVN